MKAKVRFSTSAVRLLQLHFRLVVITSICLSILAATFVKTVVLAQDAADSTLPFMTTRGGSLPASEDSEEDTAPLDTAMLDTTIQSSSQDVVDATLDTKIYLPFISLKQPMAMRMGYGATTGSIAQYTSVPKLHAGWYLNWHVQVNPARPNGIEFVQMIRLHQDLTCPLGTTPNRTVCPYKEPHSYTYRPSKSTIQQAILANPGSLWLIGNEIDRRDWYGSYQDEILPELYAEAYHELYFLIKGLDPTAKVANGGMVQITPLRLQYLDRVWNAYLQKYGVEMPVDVWNTHVFILPEASGHWGADIPAGIDVKEGSYVFRKDPISGRPGAPMPEHVDMKLFDEQVRLFRQWMKDHGQQNKPLIVTEYGVLLPNWVIEKPWDDPQGVTDFMLKTFDYFLDTKDCNVGYAFDECRLIQRWIWYSLDDYQDPVLHPPSGFNSFQSFVNTKTGELSHSGNAFRNYALSRMLDLTRVPY
jgi:hypothetical protein